ncbi:MAG: SOS response-associated peptidase [Thermoanaerobacteraceae bacterium]|nr:SOS response-associated peptidase [Thermoanaerobacteraceae bacterium]
MCGSFLLMALYSDLFKYYSIDGDATGAHEPGDFFPNKRAPIIIDAGKRTLQYAKWGFLHSHKGKLIINARAESVMSKPMFKDSFLYRRCVIPANFFYEWKQEEGRKVKHKIGLRNEQLISLGGIYKMTLDENSRKQATFVIITTEANEQLKTIHHRMPLIIRNDQLELWLNNRTPQRQIMNILANDAYEDSFFSEEITDSKRDSKDDKDDKLGQMSLF